MIYVKNTMRSKRNNSKKYLNKQLRKSKRTLRSRHRGGSRNIKKMLGGGISDIISGEQSNPIYGLFSPLHILLGYKVVKIPKDKLNVVLYGDMDGNIVQKDNFANLDEFVELIKRNIEKLESYDPKLKEKLMETLDKYYNMDNYSELFHMDHSLIVKKLKELGSIKLRKHKKGASKGDQDRYFIGKHFLADNYMTGHGANKVTYSLLYDKDGKVNERISYSGDGERIPYDKSESVIIDGLSEEYKASTNFEFEKVFDMTKHDKVVSKIGATCHRFFGKKKQVEPTQIEIVDRGIKQYWQSLNVKGGILLHRITNIKVEGNNLYIEYIDKGKNKKRVMHLSNIDTSEDGFDKFYNFIVKLLVVVAMVKSSRLNGENPVVSASDCGMDPNKEFIETEMARSSLELDNSDEDLFTGSLVNNSGAAAATSGGGTKRRRRLSRKKRSKRKQRK